MTRFSHNSHLRYHIFLTFRDSILSESADVDFFFSSRNTFQGTRWQWLGYDHSCELYIISVHRPAPVAGVSQFIRFFSLPTTHSSIINHISWRRHLYPVYKGAKYTLSKIHTSQYCPCLHKWLPCASSASSPKDRTPLNIDLSHCIF